MCEVSGLVSGNRIIAATALTAARVPAKKNCTCGPPSAALPEGVLQIGEVIQGSGVEVVGEFSEARTTIEINSKIPNEWKHFEK
jgi:hypothetical protein